MHKDKCLIISVPYLRNIRHSLSIPFIHELKKYGHILIISPFKFSKDDIAFLNLDEAEFIFLQIKESFISKNLLRISDYVRRAGYFGNNKKYGMPYYLNNLLYRFNKSGYFEKIPSLLGYSIFFLSFLFKKRSIWIKFEQLIFYINNFKSEKIKYIESLENVVYFQSANWGLQDRLLSNICNKKKWKSVMIPYTSDQIHCTGHLLSDHNIFAVQSDYEKELAINLHNINKDRIEVIGSIWHRNIEYFETPSTGPLSSKVRKKILYAGVTSLYFPRLTEIKSVIAIAENFPETEVDYCPYVNKEELESILKTFSKIKNVNVIPHSESMTELNTNKNVSFERDLMHHIQKITNIDVFVMSYLTSLSTDTNFISRCPLIANFIDEFDILKKRNTDEFPKDMLGNKLKVISSYNCLISSVEEALNYVSVDPKSEPYLYWDSDVKLDKSISRMMLKV